MIRRHIHNDDLRLGGGCVAGLALTIALTLATFFFAHAGLFASRPLARAGSPPRGDVIVFSNGEMVQINQYPRSQRRVVAEGSTNALITR